MVNFEKLRTLMGAAELDALLALGCRNAIYLTGLFHQEVWIGEPHGLVVIPTVVAFPDNSFAVGAQWKGASPGWGYELGSFPGAVYGDLMRPDQTIEAKLVVVAEQLTRRGLARATIGVDMDAAPAQAVDRLRQQLPEARFVPADGILYRLRSVKSAGELERIRTAVAISEGAFEAALPALRVGASYAQMSRAWASEVIERGGLPLIASPLYLTTGGGERFTVAPGLPRTFDLVTVYRGYHADHMVTVCAGEPVPAARERYDRARARQEFLRATLKAGMSKAELYQAWVREYGERDAGFFSVHSIGLEIHEEPRVGTSTATEVAIWPEVTFEVAAVVCLEPAPAEDMYFLGAAGLERLNRLPQRIITF
jgi:Xaa-Pro aminopeptidase